MPTEPLDFILYRELSIAAAKELINIVSSLLQELVNFSTNALVRCATSVSGGIDEDLALLASYRHIIEITNGIEVLLSQCCAAPAIPSLRSSFEAYLSIEYIVEDEQEYARRSLSWLVGYIHQRLEMYERLDPSTNRGIQSANIMRDDQLFSRLQLPPVPDVQIEITNLQTLLAKPHLQLVEAEYSRLRRPKWHHLFGGPQSFYDLAQHLNKGGQYDFLYRYWSRVSHSQDLLSYLSRDAQGEPTIGNLRNPEDIRQVASFAASFILAATRLVISKIRPDESLSNWYRQEVMENYRIISKRLNN